MEHCSGCRFWLNWDSEQTNLGECHRFPPRMGLVHRVQEGVESAVTVHPEDGGWPLTAPDDWCGEFQHPPGAPGQTLAPATSKEGTVGPAGI